MMRLIQNLFEYFGYQRDKAFTNRQYWEYTGKKIDWKNPKTFNEKLQVYKLSKEVEGLWRYSDKWEARKIVKKKVGAKILNKVYGTWNKAEDINFERLPKRYVLKTNHGSAWYIMVQDKDKLDIADARHKLNYWLNKNYYWWYARERQYKLIKPKVFAERFLADKKGELPDFKFYCFSGRVHLVHITVGRFTDHRRAYFDRNWKRLPFNYGPHKLSEKRYPKPKNLSKMIEIAETLSLGLKFARVDLYNVDGKIYFGEITLVPGAGLEVFHPAKYDRYYGSLLKL